MHRIYDHIIWGASAQGVSLAIELSQQGLSVLLLNKFGFPGGKVTESLSCFFSKSESSFGTLDEKLIESLRKLKFGVLFENEQFFLVHPEAFKRALWEKIDQFKIECLFHVLPIGIDVGIQRELRLFGRQGQIKVSGIEVHDVSDDKMLFTFLSKKKEKQGVMIHCFVNGELPVKLPGFNVFRRFYTPIGLYISLVLRNIDLDQIDLVFNAELNRFARFIWENYGARLMMIPVKPEVFEKNIKP